MKRIKHTIIAFLASLLLTASALAVYANAAEPSANPKSAGVDYITAYACTLRAGQSSSSTSLASIAKGKRVNNSDNSGYMFSNTSWTGVTYNAQFGYIRNDLIIPSQDCYRVTTTSGLKLRKGPGSGYGYYGTILYNTYLHVIEYTNSSWYKVRAYSSSLDSYVGYVSTSYIAQVTGS